MFPWTDKNGSWPGCNACLELLQHVLLNVFQNRARRRPPTGSRTEYEEAVNLILGTMYGALCLGTNPSQETVWGDYAIPVKLEKRCVGRKQPGGITCGSSEIKNEYSLEWF